MKKIFLIMLFLITSCSNMDYSPDTTDMPEDNLDQGKVIDYHEQSLYEVTASDSLASIARKYSTTANILIIINNLKKPYILKPGTVIKVPTIKTVGASDEIDEESKLVKTRKRIQIKPSKKMAK